MNWRNYIEGLTPNATFFPPANHAAIFAAEQSLGAPFPTALRELLRQSNGVHGKWGLGLIWPIERISDDNLRFRAHPDYPALYMPFGPLLFFADAGNGDQFFFPVLRPSTPRDDVFSWDHETDSRIWAAPSLERYLEWFLSGQLML
jgi:hypothetical protein